MRWETSISVAPCLSGLVWAQASALIRADMKKFRAQIEAYWLAREDIPAVIRRLVLECSGRSKTGSFRKVAYERATTTAVVQAIATAKRAILRCGRDGFILPVEKYDQWRDIELRFDPERTSSK